MAKLVLRAFAVNRLLPRSLRRLQLLRRATKKQKAFGPVWKLSKPDQRVHVDAEQLSFRSAEAQESLSQQLQIQRLQEAFVAKEAPLRAAQEEMCPRQGELAANKLAMLGLKTQNASEIKVSALTRSTEEMQGLQTTSSVTELTAGVPCGQAYATSSNMLPRLSRLVDEFADREVHGKAAIESVALKRAQHVANADNTQLASNFLKETANVKVRMDCSNLLSCSKFKQVAESKANLAAAAASSLEVMERGGNANCAATFAGNSPEVESRSIFRNGLHVATSSGLTEHAWHNAYNPSAAPHVSDFTINLESPGWAETASNIFKQSGFVIVTGVLEPWQCQEVLQECRETADLVCRSRRGSRGPGRYSFGNASSTGSVLHLPTFAQHLLDHAGHLLRPLLDRIFVTGFSCTAAGGDFVLGGGVSTSQEIHSDIHVKKKDNVLLPPPLLSVNFCVQELTDNNGPMQIIPCTQLGAKVGAKPLRLCPVQAGAAIVRDVRTLHSGTPNLTDQARYLPSVEYVSAQFRATNRKDRFPPRRSLPYHLFEQLNPDVKEICREITAAEDEHLEVSFSQNRSAWNKMLHNSMQSLPNAGSNQTRIASCRLSPLAEKTQSSWQQEGS
eukprot:TRINITY_DN23498_c0_g1_i1.p1 TRINITY_DN23498_c0_g1~~TRINITY_DN23498_c0_g1_i1.p1  ORF type:complete len:616 (-),score=87.82 TRINITY_DN23498_c0_g1_i1:344-2191(-)